MPIPSEHLSEDEDMPTPQEHKILSNLRAVPGQIGELRAHHNRQANGYHAAAMEARDIGDYEAKRGKKNKAADAYAISAENSRLAADHDDIERAFGGVPATCRKLESRLYALEKKLDLIIEAITK